MMVEGSFKALYINLLDGAASSTWGKLFYKLGATNDKALSLGSHQPYHHKRALVNWVVGVEICVPFRMYCWEFSSLSGQKLQQ